MTYLEWNDRLAEHFFSRANAGRNVYLFATQEVIEKLGQTSGDSFQDFINGVKSGPTWVRRKGLCQRALEALDGWRARGLQFPPYIGYLALFVAAAGIEGFSTAAYYPRLRKLLGEEPEPRPLPSFDKMFALWDDLERWSNLDQEEARGIFQTRWLGSLINVGVPRAQTLLSEEELHRLPLIFARAGLDPTAIPSDREIPRIIAGEGRGLLRNRTLGSLRSSAEVDAEIRHALVGVIIDELREWSGETVDAGEGGRYQTGAIRLCCDLDRTAARTRMTFRARIPGEFPEEGLILRQVVAAATGAANQGPEIICDEWGRGWSSPLKTGTAVVNAAAFNWESAYSFEDTDGNWRLRFSGSRVRILVDGSGEGLPGLVEVRRLPSQLRFYLFSAPRDSERLAVWGSASCDGWEELSFSEGLPRGWRAFSAERATSDEDIRDDYPALALPTNVSISLQGGIRVSRGNRYFDFAPPAVAVEGANVDCLLFNGMDAGPPNEMGQFEIPHDLPELPDEEAGRVAIEARRGQQVVDRRTLYLAGGGWSWTAAIDGFRLTSFGGAAADDAVGMPIIRGAKVEGATAPQFDFASTMPVTEQGSVHYVGRQAGQIVHWPIEPMPDWSPVWVIVSTRRGYVIFCGTSPTDATPARGESRDRKRLKIWKDFLWVRRKQLRPPAHLGLRKLWQKYQEIARDL